MRTRGDLISLLSPSIGAARAATAVDSAADVAGIEGDELTRDEALRLLERITAVPGIVGVAARFAKSRVHLVWDK